MSERAQQNGDSGKPGGLSSGRRWMRRLFYAFLFLIVMLFSASLLLRWQPVQQYVIDKLSQKLSERWQTEVSLGEVNFKFFNRFVLEDVLILDQSQDTAVACERLTIDLLKPLRTLAYRHLVVEQIRMEHGRIRVVTRKGEEKNNISRLLGLPGTKDSTRKGKNQLRTDLNLIVDRLWLDSILYEKSDENQGTYQRIFIPGGMARIGEIEFDKRAITLTSIRLDSPKVYVRNEATSNEDVRITETLINKEPEYEFDSTAWTVDIGQIELSDASFQLENKQRYDERQRAKDVFDWAFLSFSDIDIRARDFHHQDLYFTGALDQLSLHTDAGFDIETLSAEQYKVGRNGIALTGFHLKTPYTSIQDELNLIYQGYPDFKDFVNQVELDAQLDNSHLVFRDLVYFAPGLRQQAFISNNLYEQIAVRGRIEGTINSLDARSMFIELGQRAHLSGTFSSNNLAIKGEQKIRLNIQSLHTEFKTLRTLLPTFNPPQMYDRLGKINFRGTFQGTFEQFFASGRMDTELGLARMDLEMNISEGREQAAYSGDLSLIDFDLGAFSGNRKFGAVGFSATVNEASGLTLQALDAVLEGKIDYLNYSGYTYQNIEVDGRYREQEFEGKLAIQDPNIDFSLQGNILFDRENPLLDFEAELEKMDLKALNLMDSAWVFSGHVDLNFEGLDIDETTGSAIVRNARINTYDGRTYALDTLQLITRNLVDSTRIIQLESGVVTMDMRGKFLFSELWPLSKKLANTYYPSFARFLGWRPEDRSVSDAALKIDFQILNTGNLLELIHPELDTIRDASVNGYIQSANAHMHWEFSFPRIKYKNWEFYDIYEYTNVDASLGNLVFTVDSTVLGDKLELEAINLFADLRRDSIDFTINSFQYENLLNQLNIEGVFYLKDRIPSVEIQNSGITIMGDKWTIGPDNYIRAGRDTFVAHNVLFAHGDKRIQIRNRGRAGLELDLNGFNLDLINALWAFDPIDFSGNISGRVLVDDIFRPVSFKAQLNTDSLFLNEICYGSFGLEAHLDSTRATPVMFNAELKDTKHSLTARGHFYPPGKRQDVIRTVDVGFELENFPLKTAEFFLGDGISSTRGVLNGTLQWVGTEHSSQMLGTVKVTNGATRINYLGITIVIGETTIEAREDLFSVSGTTIRDIYGNSAVIAGGIRHDDLRNFRLDASIDSDRFLVLNTDQSNEDLYYGHCIGEVYTEFTGTFRQPNIYVNATTGRGTRFYIQTEYEEEAGQLDYVRFVKNVGGKQPEEREERKGPRGLALTLDLTASPEAEVQIIFDERAGDIIQGTGEGEIQLNVSRAGEVRMYGQYTILQGDYLFTLPVVKKPFDVLPGSTLLWSGDPLNANIDIEAQYVGLSASPYNLISEYLPPGDEDLIQSAKNSTEVNLTMHLTGSLLRPEIAFDISFPNLTGTLKTYAENKIDILRSDQNELNRQVFGLLVLKGFLPTNTSFQGDYAARAMIFNTGSEFLSNLVSVYLSDLLNQAVSDIDAISGIDVDIGYSLPTDALLQEGSEFDPNKSEVQVQLKNRLFNDRIIFNVGGKHVSNSALTSGSYVAGNVSFEYVLTEDRRLRVRAYTSTDQVPEGRRLRYGVGLSYRGEFETMENFLRGLRDVFGLIREEEVNKEDRTKDSSQR